MDNERNNDLSNESNLKNFNTDTLSNSLNNTNKIESASTYNASNLNTVNKKVNTELDNEFMNEYQKVRKRHKNIKVFFLTLFLFFIIGGGVYLYFNKIDTKTIFQNSINDFFDNIKEDLNLDKLSFLREKNLQSELNLNIVLPKETFNTDKDVDLGLKAIIQTDRENKNIFSDISYLENNNSIINLQAVINDYKPYIKYNNMFDKTITTSDYSEEIKQFIENIFSEQKNNFDDEKKVIEGIKNILINNINNKTFELKKEKIIIEDREIELDKHSLLLAGEDLDSFLIDIINDIKNNQELIDDLSNIFGLEITNIFNYLEEFHEVTKNDNLDEEVDYTSNDSLEFCIYTKGLFSKVVGFAINTTENSFLTFNENNDLVDKNSLIFVNTDSKYKIAYIHNEDEYVLEGHKEKNNIILTFNENNDELYTIVYQNIGNNNEIVITPTDEENISLKISYVYLLENNNINYSLKLEFTNQESYEKIELSTKVNTIDSINTIPLDNVIDINDLTDEDMEKIDNNLKNEFRKSIFFDVNLNQTKDINKLLLNNYADTAEKWLNDEYSSSLSGDTENENGYLSKICDSSFSLCKGDSPLKVDLSKEEVSEFFDNIGQDISDYSSFSIKIDPKTNNICIMLEPSISGSFGYLASDSYIGKSSGCN